MKKKLLHAIGLKEIPKYVNWTENFLLFNRLAEALSFPPGPTMNIFSL